MNIAYFKNTFADESACHIGLRDRSFRFGDGLFETVLVAKGKPYDLSAHLERLKAGLKATKIKLDIKKIPALCAELIRRNKLSQGFIRITVSRGEDKRARGYLPSAEPYLIIQAIAEPYPAFKPITLWLSSQVAAVKSPAKTNSALLYTLAMMEAHEQGCGNALLLNADGYVCETASGNIFWVSGDTLYSPADALPFIHGTMQQRVLKLWKGAIRQGYFTLNALKSADEIFMTNSGIILAPVTEIKPLGVKLPIGKHTKALRKALDKEILG